MYIPNINSGVNFCPKIIPLTIWLSQKHYCRTSVGFSSWRSRFQFVLKNLVISIKERLHWFNKDWFISFNLLKYLFSNNYKWGTTTAVPQQDTARTIIPSPAAHFPAKRQQLQSIITDRQIRVHKSQSPIWPWLCLTLMLILLCELSPAKPRALAAVPWVAFTVHSTTSPL